MFHRPLGTWQRRHHRTTDSRDLSDDYHSFDSFMALFVEHLLAEHLQVTEDHPVKVNRLARVSHPVKASHQATVDHPSKVYLHSLMDCLASIVLYPPIYLATFHRLVSQDHLGSA